MVAEDGNFYFRKTSLGTGFSACNCLFDSRNCLLTSLKLGSYYKLNWPKRAPAVYWLLGTLLYPCHFHHWSESTFPRRWFSAKAGPGWMVCGRPRWLSSTPRWRSSTLRITLSRSIRLYSNNVVATTLKLHEIVYLTYEALCKCIQAFMPQPNCKWHWNNVSVQCNCNCTMQ